MNRKAIRRRIRRSGWPAVRWLGGIAVLLAGWAAPPARGLVHRVGPGRDFASLADLPTLHPGDIVEIAPGRYREYRKLTEAGAPGRPIVIRGVPNRPRPVFDGTGLDVNGVGPTPRALFQIEGDHIVIERIEFRNARNGHNGAGIRVTGAADTVIRDCRITRCEMGVMSNDNDLLLLERCEIDHNGNPEHFNGYSHNLYLEGNRTTVRFCHIHDAVAGFNFKTRGRYTELFYNRIERSNEGELSLVDGPKTAGESSHAVLIGNMIVSKPDRTGNTWKFIDWGRDMGGERRGTLYLFHNTLVAGSPRIVFLSSSAAGARIEATNNLFYGAARIAGTGGGPVTGARNWIPAGASIPAGFTRTLRGGDPGFADSSKGDYRLAPASPCRNAGWPVFRYRDAGDMERSGRPRHEPPPHDRPRRDTGRPDIGAYTSTR